MTLEGQENVSFYIGKCHVKKHDAKVKEFHRTNVY